MQLRFFKGIIDEPSIYNRAQRTNEIAAIYAAGGSGKCLPETISAAPSRPMFNRAGYGTTAGHSLHFLCYRIAPPSIAGRESMNLMILHPKRACATTG